MLWHTLKRCFFEHYPIALSREYINNNNKDFIYRGGHVTAEKLTNLWPYIPTSLCVKQRVEKFMHESYLWE